MAWKDLGTDDRALIVCQNLWLEMMDDVAPETDGKFPMEQSLKSQKAFEASRLSLH